MVRATISFLLLIIIAASAQATVDGTTGTPLGGLGTGAVKFRAGTGTFTFNDQTPTRRGDYQPIEGAALQLFVRRGAEIGTRARLTARRESDRIQDDAVFPIHAVDFGSINGINLSLRAFGPFAPFAPDSMSLPCAFFALRLDNQGSSPADVALALQMVTAQEPRLIPDRGFSDASGPHQKAVFARAGDPAAVITAGSGDDFFQQGLCDNLVHGQTNRVAVRCSLAPGDTAEVTLIFAWYNSADPQRYFYTTQDHDVTAVAQDAWQRATTDHRHALSFVSRMRSSNLPAWMIDQTLNSLATVVNNSVYTADGRYAHGEGMSPIVGTMDQMWHARLVNTQLWPSVAWQALAWWARTQKVDPSAQGQIHHDFGSNDRYALSGWDDTNHPDYRNIDRWVDLNAGFIISVYEAFVATADREQLAWFWPYLQRAGWRILDQTTLYGERDHPLTFATSDCSYDAGGHSQGYNSGLALVAYRLLALLAREMNDPSEVAIYTDLWNRAIPQFSARWLDRPPPASNYSESVLAGPWIAQSLHLGQFWPSSGLDRLFDNLVDYYSPAVQGLGYPAGSYLEWQPYLVSHLGGYALQSDRPEIWRALQFDMYERNTLDRNRVFNQGLGVPSKVDGPVNEATSSSGAEAYISIPVLWRNYFALTGYYRNRATGALWLEPHLPEELHHHLTNALLFSPEGFATLSATESGEANQNQELSFTPDRTMHVDTLYLKDTFGPAVPVVSVNGAPCALERQGLGHQRSLRVRWSGEITPAGLHVVALGDPPAHPRPLPPSGLRARPLSPSSIRLAWQPRPADATDLLIECDRDDRYRIVGRVAPTDTAFVHQALRPHATYRYRLASYNADTRSEYSDTVRSATLPAGRGEPVYAINAGGPTYRASDGIEYVSDVDAPFCAGGATYVTTSDIAETVDDPLYQTERFGSFVYTLPLPDGEYELTLKLAEVFMKSEGRRVFSVLAGADTVVAAIDVFALAGKNEAYDISIPITVQGGLLTITTLPLIDNPKLCGLLVRQAESYDTTATSTRECPECYLRCSPNPFHGETIIRYWNPVRGRVSLRVYDVAGRRLLDLVDEVEERGAFRHLFVAGRHELRSGLYICRLVTGPFVRSTRMIVVR